MNFKFTPVERFLTGPVDRYFTEGFCSLVNASNKKKFKSGGMGEVLKFVTPYRGIKKNAKKFLRY